MDVNFRTNASPKRLPIPTYRIIGFHKTPEGWLFLIERSWGFTTTRFHVNGTTTRGFQKIPSGDLVYGVLRQLLCEHVEVAEHNATKRGRTL